jgi:elongation factor Ts
MEITATLVKELRNATGAQMMLCKKALQDANGDIEEAKLILRKMGIDNSSKREGRETSSGIIYTYNHDNRVAVMIELACETDFVAKNEEFKNLAKTIAMHIAWAKPIAIDENDIDDTIFLRERQIAESQVPEGKEKFAEKIVEGKMKKFCEEVCLLNQKELQVSEGKQTIGKIIKEFSGKVGENIAIKRFIRYQVGE